MLAIVIPAYDMHTHGVHYLSRALDSIKKQSGIDLSKVDVVVSDHSVNFEIETFLSSYQAPFQLHYIRNSTHFGNISQNLNHAIQFVLQKCPSSYIKVLFQDDFLLGNDYLSSIARIAQEAKPDAIFTGATHSADGTTFYNPISPQNNPYLIFGQNSISSPSTLTISRKVCEEQLCDEQVQLLMDIDWYYRIFKGYSSIVFAPQLLVVNGVWDGQMQHQFDAQSFAKELSYILSKYEGDALRVQIPAYLEMLDTKYPEHAQQIDPMVRPLMQVPVSINQNEAAPKSDGSVDVILITQNAQEFINFSIRNALLQSTSPRMIWVVDANSSDQTQNLVERIYAKTPQVRYIKSSGAAIWQARQWGMGHSDAKYLAFLDCTQDSRPKWDLNYLKYQLENLHLHSEKIGSLGTISTDNESIPLLPLVIQLPARGLASNIVVNRSAVLNNSQLNDQLRLAEMHSQWQLLGLSFQLQITNNAQVRVFNNQILSTPETYNRVNEIFSWWSNYADTVQRSSNLLYLIRNAFVANATSPNISLLCRFTIFDTTFKEIRSSLDTKLFDKACISYANMASEVARTHFRQVFIRVKKLIGRFPFATTIHRFISSNP